MIQISCTLAQVNYGHSAPKHEVGLDKPAPAWGKHVGVFVCVCLHKGAVEEDGESPEQQGIILWKGEHQCGATATSQVEHPPTEGPLRAK